MITDLAKLRPPAESEPPMIPSKEATSVARKLLNLFAIPVNVELLEAVAKIPTLECKTNAVKALYDLSENATNEARKVLCCFGIPLSAELLEMVAKIPTLEGKTAAVKVLHDMRRDLLSIPAAAHA